MKFSFRLSILVLVFFINSSCKVNDPLETKFRFKNDSKNEISEFISKSGGVITEEYSIYPASVSNSNGKDKNIITFKCINENFIKFSETKLDSVSNLLANVLVSNIENTKGFNVVSIEIITIERESPQVKKYLYSKEYLISSFQ